MSLQFTQEMLPPKHLSWNKVLATLDEGAREGIISSLTDNETINASSDWFLQARREQMPPIWDWFIWIIMAGRGFGKALALDTLIPTPDGFKTMGDLAVGDIVFSETGRPTKIIGTSPIWLSCDCYEVTFSDGNKVVCNGDHLWTTEDKASRKAQSRAASPTKLPQTRNTREIRDTLRVCNGREINHSIPVANPVRCVEANLLIDPYVLGAWLGDGTSCEAEIACEDLQIVKEINSAGVETTERIDTNGIHYYRLGGRASVRDGTTGQFISNGSIHSYLRELNVLRNKHIPLSYLRASVSQRTALLQGLMDTDGSIANGHCEISQSDERLADDILELVCSLGMKPTKCSCQSRIGVREYGLRHRINFTPYMPVFRLERKLRRVKKPGRQFMRQYRRYITEVKEVTSVPTKCIHVDAPSSLYLFGRAFIPTHNNWSGSNWLIDQHVSKQAKNSAIIAATSADLRRFCVEGPSGILSLAPNWFRPEYKPATSKLIWPDGAITSLFTSEIPDRLRGPNLDKVWCDELAAWRYLDETWEMLQLCLRYGDAPQCVVTTTPRPRKILKELMKRVRSAELSNGDVALTSGSTHDNRDNLPERFVKEIITQYKGTRLERQEIFGELLPEFEGALWSYKLLDECRVNEQPTLTRIGVGVDPAISSDEGSDLTGIVTAGLGPERHGYVIGEHSLRASPEGWARKVVTLYNELKADVVVAEKNQGGEMVESVIHAVDDSVNVKLEHASRAKITRAEPIAAFYEQHRVHHVGTFPDLEDEMTLFLPGRIKRSPDRTDALVWVLTNLMGGLNLVAPRIRSL